MREIEEQTSCLLLSKRPHAKKLMKAGLVACFLFFTSCVLSPPPTEEHSFAKVALDAARSVEAARHSPGFFHQAEEAYRRAEKALEDRDYPTARKQFQRARIAAERAENSARLIRNQTGEVL